LIDPALREVLKKRCLENGPVVVLNDMLCCDKFDIMDSVHKIKLPTLVLCGSDDIMTPRKYSKYLAGKIDGAKEIIIEGALIWSSWKSLWLLIRPSRDTLTAFEISSPQIQVREGCLLKFDPMHSEKTWSSGVQDRV